MILLYCAVIYIYTILLVGLYNQSNSSGQAIDRDIATVWRRFGRVINRNIVEI